MTKIEQYLFFSLCLLLPSQLAYHYWLPASALSAVRLDYLAIGIYFTDLLAIVLLLINRCFSLTPIKFIPRRLGLLRFIIIFVFLNILLSLSPLLTLYRYLQIGLFFSIFYHYLHQKTGLSVFYLGFAGSLTWTGILGITQFLLSSSIGGPFWFLGERPLSVPSVSIASINLADTGLHLRSYATFPHPNALAGYLLVGLVTLWLLRSRFANRSARIVYQLTFIFSLVCLLLTFSLSAYLAGILLIAVYLLSLSRVKIPKIVLSGLLIIVSLIAIIAYRSLRPTAFITRLQLTDISLRAVYYRPVFGTGLGAYLLGIPNSIAPVSGFYQPVHNLYLLLAIELGIPIFSLLAIGLVSLIRSVKSTSILLPLYSIIILGMLDHYWFTSHSNLLLLLISIVLVRQNYLPNHDRSN